MADSNIEVQIRLQDQLTSELRKVQNTVQSGFSDMGGSVQKFNAIVAAAQVAIGGIGKALEFAERGAAFDEQMQGLDRLAASYLMTADDIITAMRDAASGTISSAEAMQSAVQSLAIGLSPQQATQMMQMAETLSDLWGKPVAQVFEQLTQSVAKFNDKSLASVGILIENEQVFANYAKSIGKASDDLTEAEKRQAMLNAVLTEGQKVIAKTGGAVESTADKFDQFRAAIADLVTEAARLWSDLAANSSVFADLATYVDAAKWAVGKLHGALNALNSWKPSGILGKIWSGAANPMSLMTGAPIIRGVMGLGGASGPPLPGPALPTVGDLGRFTSPAAATPAKAPGGGGGGKKVGDAWALGGPFEMMPGFFGGDPQTAFDAIQAESEARMSALQMRNLAELDEMQKYYLAAFTAEEEYQTRITTVKQDGALSELENAQNLQDMMLGIQEYGSVTAYERAVEHQALMTDLWQQTQTIMKDNLAGGFEDMFTILGSGSKKSGQEVEQATKKMVGAIASAEGRLLILKGIAQGAEGIALMSPAKIAGGAAMIAAGGALLAFASAMGKGGGAGGGGSGGGAQAGGRGLTPSRTPGENIEKAAKTPEVNIYFEGDSASIARYLSYEIDSVARQENLDFGAKRILQNSKMASGPDGEQFLTFGDA